MSPRAGPVLIVGAGISGLTLAQACRKNDIPFRIFDRDASAGKRSAGWGLTLHWSLPTFLTLLPDDVVSRLPETYVNKRAVDAGEKGSFTFFDLTTGDAKWRVPAAERIRVSRQRLRDLMQVGLEVEWSKKAESIIRHDSGDATLTFSDGTSVSGSCIVGCDGARSAIRRIAHSDCSENNTLPVRFIGAGPHYTESQIERIRDLDPFFLQGSDPKTNAYLWFSFLDVPGDGGEVPLQRASQETYRCQVMISWPFQKGFLGRSEATEMPNTSTGQLSLMMTLSENWAEPFRSLIRDIPRDSEIKPIELADWLPRANTSDAFGGRVTLVGDAAHTMVMFRGEGANHAIVDVAKLLEQLMPIYREIHSSSGVDDGVDLNRRFEDAIRTYETEMIERGELAVLASRQACLDANDYSRVNDTSPLIRKRVMKADLEP